MNGLILHCGAEAITRNDLYALPQPIPMGPRHCPIHHADFVDEVEGVLVEQGYEIKEQAYGVTQGGNKFFGLASVTHSALREFDGGEFVIGFRGSHDQSLPRGLAGGGRLFICDNLAFNGELVLHTKQTTNIHQRLPILLHDMIEQLGTTLQRQVVQYDSYRATTISQSAANDAILELGRRDVVNWSELGKVVSEWDNPSHDEFAEDGDSVWRLFNAATEVLRIRNPAHPRLPTLAPKTATLHRICDQLSELPLAA